MKRTKGWDCRMDKFDFSKLSIPQIDYASLVQMREIPEIAEEDTIWFKMEQQHNILLQQLEQQNKSNELLIQNYNQLKDLFDLQKAEYDDAKRGLKKSQFWNRAKSVLIGIVSIISFIFGALLTLYSDEIKALILSLIGK